MKSYPEILRSIDGYFDEATAEVADHIEKLEAAFDDLVRVIEMQRKDKKKLEYENEVLSCRCDIYEQEANRMGETIAARRQQHGEPVGIGPEWTPCVKLPVTVYVRNQRPGETHVSTREGITPVNQDDLIMRGVQGEEYPIGRKIFEQTYRLGEAAPRVPDCNDCANRGQVDGLSQETHCEHCIYGSKWKTNHFVPKFAAAPGLNKE